MIREAGAARFPIHPAIVRADYRGLSPDQDSVGIGGVHQQRTDGLVAYGKIPEDPLPVETAVVTSEESRLRIGAAGQQGIVSQIPDHSHPRGLHAFGARAPALAVIVAQKEPLVSNLSIRIDRRNCSIEFIRVSRTHDEGRDPVGSLLAHGGPVFAAVWSPVETFHAGGVEQTCSVLNQSSDCSPGEALQLPISPGIDALDDTVSNSDVNDIGIDSIHSQAHGLVLAHVQWYPGVASIFAAGRSRILGVS